MHPVSRREFLRRSALLAGLAGGSLVLPGCDTGLGTPKLSSTRERTLAAFAEAVLPGGGAFQESALELGVVERMQALIAAEHPLVREQIAGGLTALEWLTLPWYGSRFSSLPLSKREEVLERMLDHRVELFRRIVHGLSMLIYFNSYGHESTWAAVGYEGPWVSRGITEMERP